MSENQLCRDQSSEKGGAAGVPGAGAETPLQAMVQNTVRQPCPCSPGRSMVGQRSPCSSWRNPRWSRVIFSEGTAFQGDSILEHGKIVRKKNQQRKDYYRVTENYSLPNPLHCSGWEIVGGVFVN